MKRSYLRIIVIGLILLLNFKSESLNAFSMQDRQGKNVISDSLWALTEQHLDKGELEEAVSLLYSEFDEDRRSSDPESYLMVRNLVDSLTFRKDTYGGKISQETQLERIAESILMAQELGNKKILANEYYRQGILLRLQGFSDSAITSFKNSIKEGNAGNYHVFTLKSYYQISVCLARLGKFEEAVKLTTEYLDKAVELDDKLQIQTAYEKLGNIHHYNLQNHEKAREYTLKSLELALKSNLDPTYSYGTLGSIYAEMDSLEKSFSMYRKAIEVTKDDYAVAGYSIHLGYIYMEDLEVYDSALHYFEIGYEAASNIGYEIYLAVARGGAAVSKAYLGDPQSAIKDLLENYENLDKYEDNELKLNTYKGLSVAYEKAGIYKPSLKYFKEFKKLSDSLYNIEKFEAVTVVETKYETEKKEQQIALLSKENELQEVRLDSQKQQKTAFMVGGLLLLIILMVVVVALINKQKAKRLIEGQKEEIETIADQLRS
ncbi:MAG: tetratricopeptide repeat protein, partial [Bacteroidota bacterium]